MKTSIYSRHRFHPDIIRRAIWMYFRFNLSFRDVEELMIDAASTFPMKQSEGGSINSGLQMRGGLNPDRKLPHLFGIWMKFIRKLRARWFIYGEL